MFVHISGRRVSVDASASIGKGGEADVFDLRDGTVLKLWKGPDHPDLVGLREEQEGARERLATHQHKLRELPRDLPEGVVGPIDLATDRGGKQLVGFTMRHVTGAEVLLRYAEPAARRAGLPAAEAISALRDLHRIVGALHARGLVIGDFNDLNVLVQGGRAFLIDADSLQFGRYLCRVYTERFVDPLLCDPDLPRPVPVRPHSPSSDWYAFAAMLLQSIACVGPHGGVFRPADPARRVPQPARPLRRITVFDREVVYPRPALPLAALPDDLLAELEQIFVHDRRGPFPRALLEDLRVTRCTQCGAEHARAVCPRCVLTAGPAITQTTVVRGSVTATRIFETRGAIVFAAAQEGVLRFVAHEGDRYLREDGREILRGPLDPSLGFAIQGELTLVGRGAEVAILAPGRAPERLATDVFQGRPVIAANARRRFWSRGGALFRGALGGDPSAGDLASRLARGADQHVGEVLAGQTRLWVGERFGLGFYRAGALSVAFVFGADRGGLTDTVKLPFLPGEIVGAHCVFDPDRDRAYVLLAAQHRGRAVHQCVCLTASGEVIAAAEATRDDGSWLGALGGKCAAGGFLLATTDEGVVRVEPRGRSLVETRRFPDTEPFVDPATRLFTSPRGLWAAGEREVHELRIA